MLVEASQMGCLLPLAVNGLLHARGSSSRPHACMLPAAAAGAAAACGMRRRT
jgi:hypothetical protein